jgi:hypothetical protein
MGILNFLKMAVSIVSLCLQILQAVKSVLERADTVTV